MVRLHDKDLERPLEKFLAEKVIFPLGSPSFKVIWCKLKSYEETCAAGRSNTLEIQ
jgi:hypothetical protein